ncbi:MAG TPA: MCE family protein [Caldithrix abyssi]|uniref:MCE family protein n=1 Tax=Caldithrix abyssi TaxID=187145 RepID=A0A7V5LJY4_CALAY|nr:MCE family protein [Caldithrix abyssi]
MSHQPSVFLCKKFYQNRNVLMKKNVFSTEIKVGLTVVVATFILVYGIIWGKGYRLHINKYQLQLLFDNVGGMVPGDPVTVNGVKEGKVLSIDWQDRDVLVTIELNDRVKLFEDASFIIISAELLAGMKVEIDPGKSNKKLNLAKQPFRGKYGGRIVDVGLTIDKLAQDMSSLTFRLDTTTALINDLLKSGHLQKSITSTLNNLDQLSSDFAPVPDSLKTTINRLNLAIKQINQMIGENRKPLNASLQEIQAMGKNINQLTSQLNKTMKEIESQRGTLGKVVYDSTLYKNLNKTLLTVDSLARRLRKKGLKLSLF